MAAKKTTTNKTKKETLNKKINKEMNETSVIKNKPLFIHGIVWVVLSVVFFVFIYFETDATLSSAVKGAMGGLFGFGAYLIPLLFIGTFLYMLFCKSIKKLWIKFSLCLLELIDTVSLIALFSRVSLKNAFDVGSKNYSGGGIIGSYISSNFSAYVGGIISFIVLFLLNLTLICFILHFNAIPYLIKGFKSFCGISTEMGKKVKTKYNEKEAELRERKEQKQKISELDNSNKTLDSKGTVLKFEPVEENELPESLSKRLKENKKNIEKKRPKEKTINILNDFANEISDGKNTVTNIFDDPVSEQELYDMKFNFTDQNYDEIEKKDSKKKIQKDESISISFNDSEDNPDIEDLSSISPVFEINQMQDKKIEKEKNITESEKESIHGELKNAMSDTILEYKFPTLDLLDAPKKSNNDNRQELYRRAEQLISVLDNFGVKAKPVQVTQGPTVTRYEIQPSSGTKLSKIVGLADDIALNLAVSTVLIAPVPGKAATVGVEIPNQNVSSVTIREMLESTEFRNAKSKLTVCLGKDIGGNVIVGDIAKWPHALIAGATGSGKSVCINTIITSILYKADPNEVKLIMVDPKQVELGVYNGIPHLLIPVVTEAKKAAGALNWAVSEMMQRYDKFKDSGVRKLEMYNKLMDKNGGEKMPQIVIIIDELADLMMVAAKEVEDYICRLAQLARAAGIHLIIATQRPSVDVITGLIKANVPSRIAFFVSSQVDSRTILDKAGAEKLLGMGDMLYFPTGARATTRVQGAFVSDGEVERIIDYIKETSPETHYREDLADHIERIQLGENGVTPDKDDDGDPLLHDAITLAVELGKISTSMVQRRLSVGYSRAGRMIDQMEARGIIGPANGAKPREVLMSHADMIQNDPVLQEENKDE